MSPHKFDQALTTLHMLRDGGVGWGVGGSVEFLSFDAELKCVKISKSMSDVWWGKGWGRSRLTSQLLTLSPNLHKPKLSISGGGGSKFGWRGG